MSNKSESVEFVVIDIPVPTYQEGPVMRPCTVAFRRVGARTVELGLAICNTSQETFSAHNGRAVALGRLVRRPIRVTSEAKTTDGIAAMLERSATVENLWRANRSR